MNTILRGGDGHPPLLIRDQGWQAQVAAERRQKQDEEIKAAVAQIEHDAALRRFTSPLSRDQLAAASAEAQVYVAESKRRREEPAQLARQQAELEDWARSLPPRQPDEQAERERARRERDNAYSFGLAKTMAQPHCGHRSCIGRCLYGGA